ncbi:hypothetical protein [Verminephrobacter aporrectodeae]|uniref:hypothetical protein n=1 Tax=Verminephrobacter aporrectodeae TaxID=1110389 RepID=UPI0009DA6B3B|nr:hypothetical protein [Verminephrobacter aporrectodeae]MCW5255449.1 hypothetical protein [Verminephrobacter aporrectodeae subsp. tuberculatae]MCW8174886.1 hypothetical protein [Verminephrobacter aporrectodeae subsp. tuberculatae]MCW8204768.1 hypothetical protein [Verminephrobacter aporrectodeae subsp. tuberculatae]MCW8209447.1 hypothetical protein [Verminephrobacter aporrectodeae subsp. tuberculatae]
MAALQILADIKGISADFALPWREMQQFYFVPLFAGKNTSPYRNFPALASYPVARWRQIAAPKTPIQGHVPLLTRASRAKPLI